MERIHFKHIGVAAMLVGIALAAFGVSQASASCCFLDGTCADVSQSQCLAGGGVYFDGVTCAFHPCPPLGACCLPNGSCSIRGQVGCQNQGGVWYEGQDCSVCGGGPDVAACCFPDGSCEDLTAAQCSAAGGEFHAEQTCALHPCLPPPGEACPRSPGFWKQQCRCSDGEGGPVKFSCSEFDQIAACIDAKSSFFSWGGGHGSFCSIIDPSGSNPRKEAQRQFVALLANVCAGELGISANNGGDVSLPESTPIDCGDLDATTIGELIDEINDLLADLEGDDLGSPSVQDSYNSIITCLDRFNNGIGVPACGETDDDDDHGDDDGDDDHDDDDSDKGGLQSFAPNSAESRSWGGVKGIFR